MPMRQVPGRGAQPAAGEERPRRAYGRAGIDPDPQPGERRRKLSQVEIEAKAEPVAAGAERAAEASGTAPRADFPPPRRAAEPEEPPRDLPIPNFAQTVNPPPPPKRMAVKHIALAVVGFALTVVMIGLGIRTRAAWVAKVSAVVQAPVSPGSPTNATLGLKISDREGQVEIDWDRHAAWIQRGSEGVLEITDGGPLPQSVSLDSTHLRAGAFHYARQTAQLDVRLIVRAPDGREVRDVASFLGKLPVKAPKADDDSARQRDQLQTQQNKLKTDLNWQVIKTKKLEKELQSMKDEMKTQQQRRMANQLDGKQ
jgi:hypothetical protein